MRAAAVGAGADLGAGAGSGSGIGGGADENDTLGRLSGRLFGATWNSVAAAGRRTAVPSRSAVAVAAGEASGAGTGVGVRAGAAAATGAGWGANGPLGGRAGGAPNGPLAGRGAPNGPLGGRAGAPATGLLGGRAGATGDTAASVATGKLSSDELVATVVTLATAGHETTTGLLANGILALHRNPGQREILNDRPELSVRAVEEMLRYDAPFQRTWRVTTEPVTLGGVAIADGAIVSQLIGAANRDPAAYEDPDTLDITRPEARHVAFGFGTHFCLGAPLARLEAQLAIPALRQRLGDLDVDESRLEWVPNNTFHSPSTMTVRVRSSRATRRPATTPRRADA